MRRGSARLLLVRHAKASFPSGVPDHDRPLTARGKRDAMALGFWLEAERFVPDLVLCSTAARALTTWELAARALSLDVPSVVEQRLYAADAETVLEVLRSHGGDAHTVAVVGHEPGLSTLARTLADDATSDPEQLASIEQRFPTTGVAILRLRLAWAALDDRSAALTRVVVPHAVAPPERPG